MSSPAKRSLVYLITEGKARPENFRRDADRIIEIVTAAIEERVSFVQVREKQLNSRQVFDLTRSVVEIARGSETRVLVNDRFDIALAAAADGVHLTSRSMSSAIVRSQVPEKFLIGVSTHSNEDIRGASGADFVVYGPVFNSPGKNAAGLATLRDACSTSDLPVIAIGGVDETNFQDVLDAGAAGFAAIRSLNDPVRLGSITSLIAK